MLVQTHQQTVNWLPFCKRVDAVKSILATLLKVASKDVKPKLQQELIPGKNDIFP
jgi:hypothetical protein